MNGDFTACSTKAYYPWLDCLRGLSWVLVIIAHTTSYGYVGRMGVGLFFAVSGWLITEILLSQDASQRSLQRFYTRRCLRILPLYYLVIFTACAVSFFFPHWLGLFPFLGTQPVEHHFLPRLFTFSMEFWRGGLCGILTQHCWSLCVEERFYVFWPLLLALCPASPKARRAMITLMIVVWAIALRGLSYNGITLGLWGLPFPLLLGCAFAIFFHNRHFAIPKYVSMIVASVAFCIYLWIAKGKEPIGPTMGTFGLKPSLLALVILACAVWTAGSPRNIVTRIFQELGKLSYAAYLIHPVFAFTSIMLANKIGHPLAAPFMAIAMCTPVAYLVHHWIETPILNIRETVERSRWARLGCACLQVVPTCFGLAFIFPWRALGVQIRILPNLFVVLGVLAASAIVVWALSNRRIRQLSTERNSLTISRPTVK